MDPRGRDMTGMPVRARLLEYVDIPTAVDNTLAAFEDDPMHGYLSDTPDARNPAANRASQKADFSAMYAQLVHRHTIWTIENAASVVGYIVPDQEQDPFEKLLEKIFPGFPMSSFYKNAVLSTEQKKRRKELIDKADQAIKDVLGDRRDSMFYIGIVWTAPAEQGHGYASALIRIVTAKADHERRSTWLVSSNKINERFYNSVGFKTEKEFLLGDNNPTWTGPPIPIALMVREYDGSRFS